MALIRGNGGLDIICYVRDPEKAHPWAEQHVLAYFRQNPSTAVGCSELQEPKKVTRFGAKVTHARKRNAWEDRNELFHRCRGPRRDHLCRFVLRSLTVFGRGGG